MRMSDWSSDVCSSDLPRAQASPGARGPLASCPRWRLGSGRDNDQPTQERAMAGTVDGRLKELGIEIPTPAAPAANYIPYVKSGNQVFVSGQIPMVAGKIEGVGKVGRDLTTEQAKAVARTCAINLIAQAKEACDGDLD